MRTHRAIKQERLFEVAPRYQCTTAGAARVAFGSAAEEIACNALGLDRIKINGTFEVNFDAERDGVFYEIKSTRQASGKIVLYECRMKKEREFPGLVYCIIVHRIAGVTENILERMAASCEIVLCPAEVVRDLAAGLALHIPKKKAGHGKRFGYTREGYIDGYKNLPIRAIMERVRIRIGISASIYGVTRIIPVYIV